jgi:predicted ATP-grasp superfamily ATP-dependent carboligase/protein-tyrosine-phosphatase
MQQGRGGSPPSGRVLVLGDGDLAALAIVRSLGRMGLEVHLASFEDSPVTRHSRYVARRHSLGHPLTDGTGFAHGLLALLSDTPFDLVVPTSDKSLVPLMAHRESIDRLSRFVAPSDAAFRATNRKDETIEIARACGLRVPATVRVESLALDDVPLPAAYPVVLKPIVSHSPGRIERNRVRIVRSADELAQRLPEMVEACPVLVQDFSPGRGVGVSVLASGGAVTAAFQHERVHEPPEGGAGSYRRSAPLSRTLLEGVRRFCKAIEWNGPAMFEFKQPPAAEEPVLMEVNGRFWGSLALAIQAGVDFPRLLYNEMVLGRAEPVLDYRQNYYVRHTVRDLSWLYSNLRAPSGRPDVIRVPLLQLVRETANLPLGREGFDLESLSDPIPAVMGWRAFAGETLTTVVSRTTRSWDVARVERRMARWRRSQGWRDRLRSARSILFVCQGNINRSAVAARVLAGGDQPIWNGVRVASAGLDPRRGRRSTSVSRRAAADLHVDLTSHASTPLTREMLAGFDVVIAMEARQVVRIIELEPSTADKCLVLSVLDPNGGPVDIPDPDGKARETFTTVYERVLRCVEALRAELCAPTGEPALARGDARPRTP